MVAEGKKVFLQIIAFNDSSNLLFDDGPRELTIENKIAALSFLDSLSAQVETVEPWDEICSALESDSVEQIILLSASIPTITEGDCAGITGNYTEIINNYNRNIRSESPLGTLIIDTISFFHNFCETTKNYDENNWLGLLSSGEESVCTHIN